MLYPIFFIATPVYFPKFSNTNFFWLLPTTTQVIFTRNHHQPYFVSLTNKITHVLFISTSHHSNFIKNSNLIYHYPALSSTTHTVFTATDHLSSSFFHFSSQPILILPLLTTTQLHLSASPPPTNTHYDQYWTHYHPPLPLFFFT